MRRPERYFGPRIESQRYRSRSRFSISGRASSAIQMRSAVKTERIVDRPVISLERGAGAPRILSLGSLACQQQFPGPSAARGRLLSNVSPFLSLSLCLFFPARTSSLRAIQQREAGDSLGSAEQFAVFVRWRLFLWNRQPWEYGNPICGCKQLHQITPRVTCPAIRSTAISKRN